MSLFHGAEGVHASNSSFTNVSGNQINYSFDSAGSDEKLLADLSPVAHSHYVEECMEGTRTDVIAKINGWIDNMSSPNIFWLKGSPGAGKSAIAATMVSQLRNKRRLGSRFFFKSGHDTFSNPINLWRTFAADLVKFDPCLRAKILEVLKDQRVDPTEPDIKAHFQRLIQEPLQSGVQSILRYPVFIIDAFDECATHEPHRRILLETLKQWVEVPRQFKLLITSRDHHDIATALRGISQSHVLRTGDLVNRHSNNDIHTYLSTHFHNFATSVVYDENLPPDWPGPAVIQQLTHQAAGLFIWAKTVVKMFEDEEEDPGQQLSLILTNSSQANIDRLYSQILDSAFGKSSSHHIKAFKAIVGGILVARIPLYYSDLRHLLQLPERDTLFSLILRKLRPVITAEALDTCLHISHQSFSDFICDSERCPARYVIDLRQSNSDFAASCLKIMNHPITGLQFNICQFPTSYLSNEDIDGLDDKINKTISSCLSYACHFWASHTCTSLNDIGLLQEVNQFVKAKLLFWLEALSLMKSISIVSPALQLLSQICTHSYPDLSIFVADVVKFVTAFHIPISHSTPHLYLSALPFAPSKSLVSGYFSPDFARTLHIQKGKVQKWPAILSLLEGHTDMVHAVAISPNGKHIASGSWDNTIRLWDADSGKAMSKPFTGHLAVVICVDFSPDSKYLVSCSQDKTIRVWDIDTGKVVSGTFEGHSDSVNSVAFSPDGKHIASGSHDMTVRVWDAESGKVTSGPFEGHTDWVKSVAFSPDSKYIVSGAWDQTIRVWDAMSGDVISGPFKGHTDSITSVVFSPDGKRIASGSHDKTILVWDAKSGKVISGPFEGHTDRVKSVAFSPDGKHIVSGSHDMTVRVWNAKSGEVVSGPFEGHTDYVKYVVFSPDGKHVVSGSDDKTVRVWDAESGRIFSEPFTGHRDAVTSVAFSPNGQHIVSGSWDRTVRVWDANSGNVLSGPFKGHTEYIKCVTFSPDGKHIVSSSDDKTIRVWNAESGKVISGPFSGYTNWINSVAFSSDGKYIVSGSEDHKVQVWDVELGEVISGPCEGHTDGVTSVAFSPNGKHIASGSWDKTVQVWDTKSGEIISGPFKEHTDHVTSIAFSPNGKHIVSGSWDKTIRVWDVESGEVVSGPFEGHTDNINSVAFSTTGKHIVSGSWDRTVRVWDAESGEVISGPFKGHTDHVNSVAFSPDGKHIVSGSDDQTVRVWDAQSGLVIPEDCKNKLDTLSTAEATPDPGYTDNSRFSNGWMHGQNGELLFWVPPSHRTSLWRPSNVLVIGQNSTRLDLSEFVCGTEWAQCQTSAR